jgi:hypothetical protein
MTILINPKIPPLKLQRLLCTSNKTVVHFFPGDGEQLYQTGKVQASMASAEDRSTNMYTTLRAYWAWLNTVLLTPHPRIQANVYITEAPLLPSR